MNNWLLGTLLGPVDKIAGYFFAFIGYVFTSIAQVLLNIASWVLENTLFAPISFTNTSDPGMGGVVAQAFQSGWYTVLFLSGGIALTSLSWGLFQMHFGAAKGAANKHTMVEGFVTYAAVVVAGSTFLTTMLNVSSQVTRGLLDMTNASIDAMFANGEFLSVGTSSMLGITTGVAAVLASLAWPSALLILGLGIFWVVLIWLYRQVDLVFFTILLPITAALSIGGPKRAFEWNFQEAVGALFSQVTMALAWFVAWLFITGANVTPTAPPESAVMEEILPSLLRLVLGIMAIFMVGKAPKMLQNIAGNSHAGIGGIALGTAGGFMLAHAARQAMSMTPAGAAISAIAKSRQAAVSAQVASWGDKSSVGTTMNSLIGRTSIGQGLQQKYVQGKAKYDSSLSNAGPIVRGVAGGIQGAINKGRSAASFIYQPRATLGHAVRSSIANEAMSRDALETYQVGEEARAFARKAGNEDPTMQPSEQELYGAYRAGAKRGQAHVHSPVSAVRLPGNKKARQAHYDELLFQRLDEFKGKGRKAQITPKNVGS